MTADEQLDAFGAGLEEIFGSALTGAYVHGSKVLDCFDPTGDLDVLGVLTRPSSADEKRRPAALCLALSGDYSGWSSGSLADALREDPDLPLRVLRGEAAVAGG